MNIISKLNTAVAAIVLSLALFSSCTSSNDYTYGEWLTKADFDGYHRWGSAFFVLGGYGYVVGGNNSKTVRLSDAWRYNFSTNQWQQVASFPGEGRENATGFSCGGYGFVTCGRGYNATTLTTEYLRDTWKFDPNGTTVDTIATGTSSVVDTLPGKWVQVSAFPWTARYGALSVSFSDAAIVGCGYNDEDVLKEMYSYNPSTDTWTKITFPGKKRFGGMGVAYSDSVAYIGFGDNDDGYNHDFWKYNRKTGVWTQERDTYNTSSESYDDDYTTLPRAYAGMFKINNKIYVALGTSGSIKSDYWEYTPSTDLWNQDSYTPITKHSIGTGRYSFAFFNYNNEAFISTGCSSASTFYDTSFQLVPDVHDDDD
jgi:N-acetylneuraminic acid mutarotase